MPVLQAGTDAAMTYLASKYRYSGCSEIMYEGFIWQVNRFTRA
ncbi:hypothetical protein C7420_103332 [Pantoea ananatis]|jgi:hypothetical protein|nr:hypothetical protein C7422_102348 [Pantoea ananatis]RAR72155.1 hypothetical protein C7420_103332 [Pantoea ananatis]CCF11187.1 hypothetical protein PANA5342_3794 [Pantoea ananatis LMG 5342]CRH32357.1 Uncharacterized protein BN1183_AC_03010 [Pantoea ananatis]CRH36117.1 Uncharacterized protein {ECO:0000313/EMBL:CCF11187.1} [Pantoea ananatis]